MSKQQCRSDGKNLIDDHEGRRSAGLTKNEKIFEMGEMETLYAFLLKPTHHMTSDTSFSW